MTAALVAWAWHRVGYLVRPYDMLADRRRWCWQPRTPCGYSRKTPPAGSMDALP